MLLLSRQAGPSLARRGNLPCRSAEKFLFFRVHSVVARARAHRRLAKIEHLWEKATALAAFGIEQLWEEGTARARTVASYCERGVYDLGYNMLPC